MWESPERDTSKIVNTGYLKKKRKKNSNGSRLFLFLSVSFFFPANKFQMVMLVNQKGNSEILKF